MYTQPRTARATRDRQFVPFCRTVFYEKALYHVLRVDIGQQNDLLNLYTKYVQLSLVKVFRVTVHIPYIVTNRLFMAFYHQRLPHRKKKLLHDDIVQL